MRPLSLQRSHSGALFTLYYLKMLKLLIFVAYTIACVAFYYAERTQLINLLQTYTPWDKQIGDFETAVVFAAMAIAAPGYISGFRRLVALVFMY